MTLPDTPCILMMVFRWSVKHITLDVIKQKKVRVRFVEGVEMPKGQRMSMAGTALLAVLVVSAVSGATTEQVERKYLERAAKNIEDYRMDRATIRFTDGKAHSVRPEKVEIEQISHDFLFGCIIFDLIGDNAYKPLLYKKRFSRLFNFAVFPFYWKSYERRPGHTRREEFLPVLRWCRDNGITCKGHPLVWTHQAGVPEWLSDRSPEAGEKLLEQRVRNIVSGYRDHIQMWDVVNESVHTRTWSDLDSGNYVQEPVDDVADYVEKCFRWAHAANPDATLILNEYSVIPDPSDRERFISVIEELKARNAPLSAVGLQAHEPRQEWYSPREVWETLEEVSGTGYPIHITEFIPQSGGKKITGGWREGRWTAENQAEYAAQMYTLCFGHPSIRSINWWGFSDRRIWQEGGGLVDEEYDLKPVYRRLYHLIQEEWTTERTIADVPEDGPLSFRGFHGRYRVSAHLPDGDVREFKAHLGADGKNSWTFVLQE